MNEIETNTEHMKALQALAKVNLEISTIRENLDKLQKEEADYLVSREKKALEHIQKVVDDSKLLIAEANENYEAVEKLAISVKEASAFLSETYEKFSAMTSRFTEKQAVWNVEIAGQQKTVDDARAQIKAEGVRLKAENEGIELRKLNISKIEKKLNDERGTLDRAIERLKKGKI